jgi:16S rRNA (guanine527-N7)-methyltransferase
MPALSESAIATLLAPYLPELPKGLPGQLSTYLDLLLKWNARTNLTAIRDPEDIVRRHFGESLFVARHLNPTASTLLDFGSGAGFPGLPIALLRPELRVTLAESQNKKATFLREVIRTLGISTDVWAGRVEAMPAARLFDIVAMRAVDDTRTALPEAIRRIVPGGELALLTTAKESPDGGHSLPIPNSLSGVLHLQTFHVEQL